MMTKKLHPLFGTKVKVTTRLYRKKTWSNNNNNLVANCVWIEQEMDPVKVMIIGERTLRDGNRKYEGETIEFYATKCIKAFLVVKDMRSNPFYIPHYDCNF